MHGLYGCVSGVGLWCVPVYVLVGRGVVLEVLSSLSAWRAVDTFGVHEALAGYALLEDLADFNWPLACAASRRKRSFDSVC